MIDFYYMPASAPCRSILMAAKILNVDLRKIFLNLDVKQQLNEDFIKINPQHVIPTIVDDGFTLWESRAILMYLCDKYAETDELYPKDAQKRALVNQRLYFDMGTFYQSLADYYYPGLFYEGTRSPDGIKKIEFAFDLLNLFLENQTYVAGDTLTIADLALLASATTFEAADYDFSKYANVTRWLKHLRETVPGADENDSGSAEMRKYFANYNATPY